MYRVAMPSHGVQQRTADILAGQGLDYANAERGGRDRRRGRENRAFPREVLSDVRIAFDRADRAQAFTRSEPQAVGNGRGIRRGAFHSPAQRTRLDAMPDV